MIQVLCCIFFHNKKQIELMIPLCIFSPAMLRKEQIASDRIDMYSSENET